MKNNYLILISTALVAFGVMLQSNSTGPAASANRATGAPGDNGTACNSCHSGGTFGDVTIDLQLLDTNGNSVSEYMPGQVYSVSVDLSTANFSPNAYGFQTIALIDANDVPTNSFENSGDGVQFSTSAGRQYAEHTNPKVSGEFTFDWMAPAAGSGSVTFYAAGNAANLNGNTLGDNAKLANFSFTEMGGDTADTNTNEPPTGLSIINDRAAFSVFPNPATDVLQLNGDWSQGTLMLYSVKGGLIREVMPSSGEIRVDDLSTGLYILANEQSRVTFMKR